MLDESLISGGASDRNLPTEFAGGLAERIKESEAVAKALKARPRLSLRFQVLLGFLVVFLAAAGVATAIIISNGAVEDQVQSLEIVNDYVFKIDNARRFEKNFFLYGTDADRALESVYQAEEIIRGRREELSDIHGPEMWQDLVANLDGYEALLDEALSQKQRPENAAVAARLKQLEPQVRKHGHEMTLLARDLMRKQRRSIEEAISASSQLQRYFLVFLLLFVIGTAYLISGSIIRTILRFESYAERIGEGDFTPITPARRYRDEFTYLSLAINHMMLELQKHEAMLVQAHKMKAIGTLTAGVAHELNNPLNNITITAHMLLEDYDELDDEERTDMVGDVVGEVDRAKRIVANLLDFTRESETKLSPLDLAQLLRDTLDLTANQLKLAGVKAALDVMEDPPRILGDSQQLRQMLLNLILNGVQASERGGKLELKLEPAEEPHYVAVRVIDHGNGIPADVLPRIFDPFFTTKESGKGTGLGLSVSQGIVAKHNGRILVESKEGEGTTFSVILPVAPIAVG